MFISHKVPKQSQSRLDFVNFLHFKFVKRERERERDWWAEVKQTNTNNSDVDIEIVEQQTYGHTPTLYRQVTFHNWPDISLALIFAIAQSPSIYWIFMYEAIWSSPLSQNKQRFIWDWGTAVYNFILRKFWLWNWKDEISLSGLTFVRNSVFLSAEEWCLYLPLMTPNLLSNSLFPQFDWILNCFLSRFMAVNLKVD